MEIKIIGAGCDTCGRLYDYACKAVAELGLDAKVEKVEYAQTIEVEAQCTPKVLGRVREYVTEGWMPPKEPWED